MDPGGPPIFTLFVLGLASEAGAAGRGWRPGRTGWPRLSAPHCARSCRATDRSGRFPPSAQPAARQPTTARPVRDTVSSSFPLLDCRHVWVQEHQVELGHRDQAEKVPHDGTHDHALDHDIEPGTEKDICHCQSPRESQRQLPQRFGSGVRPHIDPPADHHCPESISRHADAMLEPLREQPRDRRLTRGRHARDHEQRHATDRVISPRSCRANSARTQQRTMSQISWRTSGRASTAIGHSGTAGAAWYFYTSRSGNAVPTPSSARCRASHAACAAATTNVLARSAPRTQNQTICAHSNQSLKCRPSAPSRHGECGLCF